MLRLPFLFSVVSIFMVHFFFHFLGPERTILLATGRNVVLFAILLLGLIFLFRLSCFQLKDRWGIGLILVIDVLFLFGIAFFFFLVRIYVFSHLGLDLTSFFPLLLSVGGSQALPLPAPYGTESSPPFNEDPFEINVLLESNYTPSETESSPSVNSVRPPRGASPEAGPSQIHFQNEELSPRLQYRLWLQDHNEPIFKEDLEVRVLLKQELLHAMQRLHPEEGFWQEQEDRLIGEALSNKRGKEFTLDQLEKRATDLTNSGSQSWYYAHMRKYLETFHLTNGKAFVLY